MQSVKSILWETVGQMSLDWRIFPRYGTFTANTGKVMGKPGQVGHPSHASTNKLQPKRRDGEGLYTLKILKDISSNHNMWNLF